MDPIVTIERLGTKLKPPKKSGGPLMHLTVALTIFSFHCLC